MKFTMQREALLQPLSQVVGVVERRQTLPILANFLLVAEDGKLSCTGTDMEVELRATHSAEVQQPGRITVPARKLVDICRALPDGCEIVLEQQDNQLLINTKNSHFTLSTLPADEFPDLEQADNLLNYSINEGALHQMLERTAFAMANQDVRYYLNGLLLEKKGGMLRSVATDGHRLALADLNQEIADQHDDQQVIVPRKGILELLRLLENEGDDITLGIGSNHIQVTKPGLTMTSKLIDGRFPEYEAVIPPANDHDVVINRGRFRTALQRAAILSNEKFRGVRLEFSTDAVKIIAHNPQQEEAVEELDVPHTVPAMSIGFNVTYLLDALNALTSEDIQIKLRDANSSCLIIEPGSEKTRHVVMPLKL